MSVLSDNAAMEYEIVTTNIFDEWLTNLKDIKFKARILARIDRVQAGNFGDCKHIESNLYELRFFFGPGFRVYYTMRGNTVILLLNGGNKATQNKDIKRAIAIMEEIQ